MLRNMVMSVIAAVAPMGAFATDAAAQVMKSKDFSEETQKKAMSSVVRIRADDGLKAWQGCGVCVAYNPDSGTALILTAGHVVKNAKRMQFELFTAQSYPNPARAYKSAQSRWWWNERDDIGIVVARIWVPYTIKLADSVGQLENGTPVLAIGCGIGAPPVCDVGRFGGLHSSGDYTVERGAIGGRSGGPLITNQGVIGILSRGRDDLTLYVSHEKIAQFIHRISDKVKAEQK